jgi:hypothetical protein
MVTRSLSRLSQVTCIACVLGALVLVLAHVFPERVAADAASGTYTGSVSLRGNYYWERSTRVIAPATALMLATPSGVRAEATYLLDAITSASQATGVQSDVGFTEVRHDASGGLGYELDLGKHQLDLSARGRFSREPDYKSRGAGFGGSFSTNERNTVLRLNGYLLHDSVYKIDRMAPPSDPNKLMQTDALHKGDLNAYSLGLAWDQVLSPTWTLTLGFDGALLDGFQSNAYRVAAYADGGGSPEHHPDRCIRSAYYVWLAHYFVRTKSALRLGYRFYHDDWDIQAHTPEVRVHQELGNYVELRLRYRYYTQTHSEFWRKGGNLRADEYITADPKMSPFHDQTVGFKLRVSLEFLSFTGLDVLHQAVLDFGVEYVFNTNRYGNGLIGQGGFTWPV